MLTWNVDSDGAGRVLIHYVDAQGDRTVREIRPLALEGHLEGHTFSAQCIEAHCYSAKATRTFRIDRIQELADPRSGEVLDLIPWLQGLPMAGPLRAEEVEATDAVAPRRQFWRWLILALTIGYAIGRFRLIRWGLHAAGKKWGLWL